VTREVVACTRCASRDLRMPGFADGLVPETDNLGEWVCRRCGLRAVPLVFDDKDAYLAFAGTRCSIAERRAVRAGSAEDGRDALAAGDAAAGGDARTDAADAVSHDGRPPTDAETRGATSDP
jgi:hypothetical protein